MFCQRSMLSYDMLEWLLWKCQRGWLTLLGMVDVTPHFRQDLHSHRFDEEDLIHPLHVSSNRLSDYVNLQSRFDGRRLSSASFSHDQCLSNQTDDRDGACGVSPLLPWGFSSAKTMTELVRAQPCVTVKLTFSHQVEMDDCTDEIRADLRDLLAASFKKSLSRTETYSAYIDNTTLRLLPNLSNTATVNPISPSIQPLASKSCRDTCDQQAFRIGIVSAAEYSCDLPPYIYSAVSSLLSTHR